MLIIPLVLHLIYIGSAVASIFLTGDAENSLWLLGGCVCCLVHGFFFALRDLVDNEDDEMLKVEKVSQGIVEIVPLGCVNVFFFLQTETVKDFAFAHLFAATVVVYNTVAIYGQDERNGTTEYLKSLTIAIFCISLMICGFFANKLFVMVIGLVALLIKDGAILLDALCIPGTEFVIYIGESALLAFTGAVAGGYLDDFEVDIQKLVGYGGGGEKKDEGGDGGGA
ncbi:uncharacterized protein LOC119662629 [Teleopsis dalmanni]|uniref:uncharacterized protein LOC119662629 n=1 Tax=Teleopsis dalmanni TaxID=139649 RepID=UPI0018CC7DCD|nr:uncharacterized protein LOC119662629 [Teleopsis dalmanni]XP_037928220.1 uncharacterized protein LOC119662629 [Teleopsis dalmanni]